MQLIVCTTVHTRFGIYTFYVVDTTDAPFELVAACPPTIYRNSGVRLGYALRIG